MNNYFPPGTFITLYNGSVKNIEDISIDDKILLSNGDIGYILSKDQINYSGNIYNIKINNNLSLFCLNKFNKNSILKSLKLNKTIESDLNINKAKLLGLYAAEGSVNLKKGAVAFVYSINELDSLVKLTQNLLLSEFHLKSKLHIRNSSCCLYVYNKDFANFCYKHCGKLSYEKVLSEELLYSNSDIARSFIIGWFDGDGHVDKKTGRCTGTTTSPYLVNQIRFLLYKFNIQNRIVKENPNNSIIEGRKIEGKHDIYRIKFSLSNSIIFENESFKIKNIDKTKIKKLNKFEDNHCLHKIKDISEIKYNGMLYKLYVNSTNSYSVNGIIMYNYDVLNTNLHGDTWHLKN